ncbi:MAG: hypothetical protein RIT28_3546 [Pseudomonadota bacterium]
MLLPCLLAGWLSGGAALAAETYSDQVFYYGDLHAHTGFSGDGGSADMGDCDGSCGNFADVFTTAKDNGLDFVALTDHINSAASVNAADFLVLHAAVLAANDEAGGFITIPAGEIAFTQHGSSVEFGHKTMLLFGENDELVDLELADLRRTSTSVMRSCDSIWTLMEKVDQVTGGAMLVPHHPAVQRPMDNDWSCFNPTWEPAVEVYSEHGSSLDDLGYDVPGAGLVTTSTVHEALDPSGHNLMFGFVGGTDSHDTRPGEVCNLDTEQPTHLYAGGLTVVVLDATETFNRASIRSAIIDRSTYITTGPQLPLTLGWSAKGVYLGGLGDALNVPEDADLDAEVNFPSDRAPYVLSVELVGPDTRWPLTEVATGRWTGATPQAELPEWLYVAVEIDGASWYGGVGACADGGDDVEWIWVSPSPLTLFDDDLDDDGHSALVDDCDDTDDDVYSGATEIWYDGIDQDCAGDDDSDQDADGHAAIIEGGGDCDDTDPSAYPSAEERWYDGVDQDCDGASDFDADFDGHDAVSWGGDDCDDSDPGVSPSVSEVWNDGIDQDCDPLTDAASSPDGPAEEDCDDGDTGANPCADTSRGCGSVPPGGAWMIFAAAALTAAWRRSAVV